MCRYILCVHVISRPVVGCHVGHEGAHTARWLGFRETPGARPSLRRKRGVVRFSTSFYDGNSVLQQISRQMHAYVSYASGACRCETLCVPAGPSSRA